MCYAQKTKEMLQGKVAAALAEVTPNAPDTLVLEYPPDPSFGDIALSCFPLAKTAKMDPKEISKRLGILLTPNGHLASVEVVGPFVNFRLHPKDLFGSVCKEIIAEGAEFGRSKTRSGERVMVEYISPNTNKPLHLGHLRNGALGSSIARIIDAAGHDVITANLVNDRGVHICKSMLALKKWGNGATPASTGMKGDHFVGHWYVRYAQEEEKDPGLKAETQEMLKKWEEGDPEIIALWKQMNAWVYEGFAETYKNFGFSFDVFYYESETYKLGKDVVQQGLCNGIFCTDEKGAVIFNLPECKFGKGKKGDTKKVAVLRADGTSVYMTQDIGTALKRADEFGLSRVIYVVANEQDHHFQALFEVLRGLGYGWAERCHHLSYGMVYLPDGRMKSREGKVIDADNLLKEMEELAYAETKKRDHQGNVPDEELRLRAAKIAVSAIKFYLLSVQPTQDMRFNPASSISFDGCTSPYCQYAYARAMGILQNVDALPHPSAVDFSLLGNAEERLLIQKLMQFPEQIEEAAKRLSPFGVVGHLYETAKAFNVFYNKHHVLAGEDEALKAARIVLVQAAAVVLKNAMQLIGIEPLENM